MIFLSSAYTDADPAVVEERARIAQEVAAEMMRENPNEFVFSLIAYAHPMVKLGLPGTFDFWNSVIVETMSRCTKVVVTRRVSGWDTSDGVRREVELANGLHIPVEYRD